MPARRKSVPFPVLVAPQLATLVGTPNNLDGYRILPRCDHGKARMFTRHGNDCTDKMPSLVRGLGATPAATRGR